MTLASLLPRKWERIKKAVPECRTAQGLDHVEAEEVEAGEAEEQQPRTRGGAHLFVGGRRGQAVHHCHHEGQEAAEGADHVPPVPPQNPVGGVLTLLHLADFCAAHRAVEYLPQREILLEVSLLPKGRHLGCISIDIYVMTAQYKAQNLAQVMYGLRHV